MRRARLSLVGVVLLACTIRHVDEAQVRSVTAQHLACDPQLVQLESEESPGEGIARYTARGCNEQRTFDCWQKGNTVQCEPMGIHEVASNGTSSSSSSEDTSASDYDTSGCDCGNLFASHGSKPASSPSNPSVMPTTQRINNNGR